MPHAYATLVAEHLNRHAAALKLSGPDDMLEVLDVWLSAAEPAPKSFHVRGMLRVVLSTTSWPLVARLAFLRRHLVGRTFSPAEEATARVLFGLDEEVAA
jgi:hypothetical protein